MAEKSKIEWTATVRKDGTLVPGHTANLWWGCTEVHDGCDNCYARVFSNRYNNGENSLWGNDAPRKAIGSVWGNLLGLQAKAHAAGEIHNVFTGSMMDIFEKPFPVVDKDGNDMGIKTDELRNRFFREIVPNSPNLRFLLLTKRPSNILKMIPPEWIQNPPANVWYGTSPVDQDTYNNLVPQLIKVPGKRFLSVEPQLGQVDIFASHAKHLNWVIQGGESGHGKRPFEMWWAGYLRDCCRYLDLPYFFKQIDKVQEVPERFIKSRHYLPAYEQ